VDVSLTKEEISGVVGNSMGELHRKDQSDGTAFDYRQIGLIDQGIYHYADGGDTGSNPALPNPR
jgi:hypothetical protein